MRAGELEFAEVVQGDQEKEALRRPGDFVRDDGILICGVCRQPKQTSEGFPIIHEHDLPKTVHKPHKVLDQSLQKQTFAVDDQRLYKVSAALKRYVDAFDDRYRKEGKGMLLWGGTGTGKTFFAACVANALIGLGHKVHFSTFMEMHDRIWNDKDFIFRLKKLDLVVLDDYGKEAETRHNLQLVFEIVDSLCKSGIPVIFTTNKAIDEFRPYGGKGVDLDAIHSRMLKMAAPIQIKGTDRRRFDADFENKAMLEELGMGEA